VRLTLNPFISDPGACAAMGLVAAYPTLIDRLILIAPAISTTLSPPASAAILGAASSGRSGPIPVLLYWSEDDSTIPTANAAPLSKAFGMRGAGAGGDAEGHAASRLHIVKGLTTHVPEFQRPDEFQRELSSFLKDTK
jgi:pimeloyl-ACP methyl ester carboxylesterase